MHDFSEFSLSHTANTANTTDAARPRIALLEDVVAERDEVQKLLQDNGFDFKWQSTGTAFLKMLQRETFDLLLLDWGVPDMTGLEVLRRVRGGNKGSTVPVLMLTARTSEFETVQALNSGADDYMGKPYRPFELLARLQVLLRSRSQRQTRGVETIDDMQFDPARFSVCRQGHAPVILSHKEFEVARLLFLHLGRPLSRTHLHASVWSEARPSTRTIDTHVSRIRHKLDLTLEHGYKLQSLYGFGYRLDRVSNHLDMQSYTELMQTDAEALGTVDTAPEMPEPQYREFN